MYVNRRVLYCLFVLFAFCLPIGVGEYCQDKFGKHDGKAEGGKKADVTGWIIGIFLCLGSALSSVLGITFQKIAHTRNEKSAVQKSYIKLPLWWLGITGVIGGALLDFISLGFAPQTVVASLGSMTLVINAAVAPIAHKEHLSRLEKVGTLTITVGAAIAVASSSQKSQDYNLGILKCLYSQSGFIAYAILIFFWCIGLVCIFRIADAKEANNDPSYFPHWAKVHPAALTALSGTLGAQSLLFAKSVSIIIRELYAPSPDSHGASDMQKYETYLILLAMVFTIVTQTHTLNMALQRFDSVIVLPMFQVFWIIMGVFGAGAYFKEFDGMTVVQAIVFPIGILIIAFGIAILTSRAATGQLESTIESLDFPTDTEIITKIQSPDSAPIAIHPPLPTNRRTLAINYASHRVSGRVLSVSGALIAATSLMDESSEINEILRQRKQSRRLTKQVHQTHHNVRLSTVSSTGRAPGSLNPLQMIDDEGNKGGGNYSNDHNNNHHHHKNNHSSGNGHGGQRRDTFAEVDLTTP